MAARQQASTISSMSTIKKVWCRHCNVGRNPEHRSEALYGIILTDEEPAKLHWVCYKCLKHGTPQFYNVVTKSKATREEYVESDGCVVIRHWTYDNDDDGQTYYGYEDENYSITDRITAHTPGRMCATCGKHKVPKIALVRDERDDMLYHDWYCADVDKYGCVKTKCWPNPKLLGTV
jgi:hypothetical protein